MRFVPSLRQELNAKRFADHLRRSAKRELPTADETEAALYAYDPSTFVAWTSYDHPTLGKVEIGGFKPWAETTPKLEDAQPLIDARLGFLPQLTAMLPKLSIGKVEVTEVSDGVYRVDTWVENRGFLPYPTHQGQRSQRPVPAVLTLGGKGVTFLEGRPRNVLGLLEGSGGSEKATWLVGGTKGTKVSLELKSAIPIDRVTVTLKEGGGR